MRNVRINENYTLYEDGSVYSHLNNIFLKQCETPAGYLTYSGQLGSIHRLLAEYFLGGIPDGMCVNHKDGNKKNNCLSNLEIVTHQENTQHAYDNGLAKGKPGETNSMASLTQWTIGIVVEDLQNGLDNETIGLRHNLHPRYVSLIRHGKRWPEVYATHGPFATSNKVDPKKALLQEKYNRYLQLKDTHNNCQIAREIGVDPSTVCRWRNNETKNM